MINISPTKPTLAQEPSVVAVTIAVDVIQPHSSIQRAHIKQLPGRRPSNHVVEPVLHTAGRQSHKVALVTSGGASNASSACVLERILVSGFFKCHAQASITAMALHQARALEDEIAALADRPFDHSVMAEKQRLYSRVGQFLVGNFSGHWWCTHPMLMAFMMRILELYPATDSVRAFYDRMSQQLGVCCKCVDLYHASMPSVRLELECEFTPTSIKEFFHKLSQLDAERIQKALVIKQPAVQPGGLPGSWSSAPVQLTDRERSMTVVALYEILSNRRLFCDFRVIRVLSKWVSHSSEINLKALDNDMFRSCPGIYHLLVSPDPGVRGWATSVIKAYGKIDLVERHCDQAFLKVLDEWMYIFENLSFNKSLLSIDLSAAQELPLYLDVGNCIKTPTNQTLWAALDTTMQQMDENSLATMLEAYDTLPDLAFNNLNEADHSTSPQVTLVIAKCYGVLLRCLGHRFWNHTVNSPKIVFDMILQHCSSPSSRVFVTKQLVDLLPSLIVAVRPPSFSESNRSKVGTYFRMRERALLFLLHEDHRPAHFKDDVLSVAATRAIATIILDCYEPRLGTMANESNGSDSEHKDDGALPESCLVDYSVSDSAFWWPCGTQDNRTQLEERWMKHLFDVVINPRNVPSLVDHVATTCATVFAKHLQLAKEAVFQVIMDKTKHIDEITRSRPLQTLLLERLCKWHTVATIPIQLHGALFGCVGGISETLNVLDSNKTESEDLNVRKYRKVLTNFETIVYPYFGRICEEVLVKGLTNPLQFPIVAQHISTLLLSPQETIEQMTKKLLSNVARNKAMPQKVPTLIEAFVVCAHRRSDSFLRSVLSLLQSMRLFGFAPVVCLPTLNKIIFLWSRSFDLVKNSLKTMLIDESADDQANVVGLRKLPNLISDFLVAILTNSIQQRANLHIDEPTFVKLLEFGISFWLFWIDVNDANASQKRNASVIPPLVSCINNGSVAERPRAAELLMIVLEAFIRGNTALDDKMIRNIEGLKNTSSIASERSTDFLRMAKKFRQLEKSSKFFAKRQTTIQKALAFQSTTERTKKPTVITIDDDGEEEVQFIQRKPKIVDGKASTVRVRSSKAAAREQAQASMGTGHTSSTSEDVKMWKQNQSFYNEDDIAPRKKSPAAQTAVAPAKSNFSMAQVIKGLTHTHQLGGSVDRSYSTAAQAVRPEESKPEEEEEEEEEDPALNFAALFHRIKTTQKPVPVCSLLPFYRHLLQVCVPALLTREFENEKPNRELQPPPLTFKKISDYVGAFLPLLVEECNNEVQEGLRKCYFANDDAGCHLVRYESEKPREGMRCLHFTMLQPGTSTSGAPRRNGNSFFKDKLFRNGDVVLFRLARGSQQRVSEQQEFLGVILISDAEKGRKKATVRGKEKVEPEEEVIKVLFLNHGELDSCTNDVSAFSSESLSADAIADSEWKVNVLSNLVTAAREYISLRSVDLLPEHLRSAILTPDEYKSTGTELLTITTVLDDLRAAKSSDHDSKIMKLLKRLDKMDITLTDLRSTGIGKAVNKLRKYENKAIQDLANSLKDKWTGLMNKTDELASPPRFLPPELWEAIRNQYNQSQLQSIYSVLNNYSLGLSLLQGPPGTGKTKTIMGLLSGFLSLRPPASALISSAATLRAASSRSGSAAQPSPANGQFTNFQRVRELAGKSPANSLPATPTANSVSPSPTGATPSFSLSGVMSSMGSILRRSDDSAPTRTTLQSLKAAASVKSRLEDKIAGRKGVQPTAIRRRVVVSGAAGLMRTQSRACNVLLCAPSNGAVDELVLRIVTDGLMDATGKVTKVRAPSVHPDALSDEVLSIVRLGNAGEDAPEKVKSVCLPHIIKQELMIHPKTVELRTLQDQQAELRKKIRAFHEKTAEEKAKVDRKALSKTHSELTQCSGKIRRLRDEVRALETKMTASILSKASIIACTLSKAGSGSLSDLQRGFDALIIDEAAQAVELSTLVPIRERVARVVLVGDPKQLPATVKSVVAAKARYDRSLFERIAESGVAPSMLRVQYRMHPFLREFPSKRFYGGLLTDGPSVMERVHRVCSTVYQSVCFQPFMLYNVENSLEENQGGSKSNRIEASFCVDLCATMFKLCGDMRQNKWNVGFVSPYREQVHALRREITRSSIPPSLSIEVNTVDGFQGREKDVIIFSCVRASKSGGIGFLKDIRRLNVAITRARFCLFVVGHVNTLVRDETWRALVHSARERKLIIDTKNESFADLAKRMEQKGGALMQHYNEMHEKINKKTIGKTNEETSQPTEGVQETDSSSVRVEENRQGGPDTKVDVSEISKTKGTSATDSISEVKQDPMLPVIKPIAEARAAHPQSVPSGQKRKAEDIEANSTRPKMQRMNSSSEKLPTPRSYSAGSTALEKGDVKVAPQTREREGSDEGRDAKDCRYQSERERGRGDERRDSKDRQHRIEQQSSHERRDNDRRYHQSDREGHREGRSAPSRYGDGRGDRREHPEFHRSSSSRSDHDRSRSSGRNHNNGSESERPNVTDRQQLDQTKEFCLANEPPSSSRARHVSSDHKRERSLSRRDRSRSRERHHSRSQQQPVEPFRKLQRSESLGSSSGRGNQEPSRRSDSGRTVSLVRSSPAAGESKTATKDKDPVQQRLEREHERRRQKFQPRPPPSAASVSRKPVGGTSGGVLGNILGAASKLAQSTSRAQDQPGARQDFQ
ncbi:TPA: hypothetical protein N0F65_006267 [Lagenidium giganteum]|uniref:TFIIS N-terminal domain-containing protein n=1 Tax=Lagenidium giganteum TaxID=4803 RepID=A0AAV2Z3Z4_9STRA|nr:TPA: hypothetical protein N0F65_006267 [Lagenidium giganteum]